MKEWSVWKKQLAAVGLFMALTGGLAGLPADRVFASQMQGVKSDVCENHESHDESCGYREAVEGVPCSHEHTEECWQAEEACVHEHSEECYAEVILCGNTEEEHEHTEECKGTELDCIHKCTEESGCVSKQLMCVHVHDADCGYAEPAEEIPCTHVCELCVSNSEVPDSEENGKHLDAVKDEEVEAENVRAVKEIQALIDALPDADSIVPENVSEMESRLAVIDERKAVLTEEELEELDFGRYRAVVAVLEAPAGEEGAEIPMLTAEVGDKFMAETEEGVAVTYQIITLPDDSGVGTVRVWGESWVRGAIDKGTGGKITIPDAVVYEGNNYEVVEVGAFAFCECTGLTEVTIPSTVTKIGGLAFERCKNLKEIVIPEGVTEIQTATFELCVGLTNIILSSGITKIGLYAFNGCENLKGITIPEHVTEIKGDAFRGCIGLREIMMPDSVTEIG